MADDVGLFPPVRYTHQTRDSRHNQNPGPRPSRPSREDHYRQRDREPSPERRSTPQRYEQRSQPSDDREPRYHSEQRMPNGGNVISMRAPRWSWAPMIVSVTSMTLFASVFGFFGLAFASFAYSDHKVGDYARSRYKIRWSWFCSVLGIIFTITAVVMLLLTMFAFEVPTPTFKHYKYWIPPWLLENIID